jgi:hypothetical protein
VGVNGAQNCTADAHPTPSAEAEPLAKEELLMNPSAQN